MNGLKLGHVLLIILGIIVGLMVGSFLLGISLGLVTQDDVVQEIERLYSHKVILFSLGIFLYYCSYIVTRTLIKRTTREEVFIAESPFGRVSVSIDAVENVVRKVLRKYEQIKRYKLNVYSKAKKLIVRITIKQWVGGQVMTVTEEVKDELKHKLHKIMGLENAVEVNLKIEKVDNTGKETGE